MAIYIKRAAEPGSNAARDEPDRVLLASSMAHDAMKDELRKYVDGSITGRSFLVSGHRGSGKSTLVKKIEHDLLQEYETSRKPFRPVLVTLSGPSMLSPTAVGATANATPASPTSQAQPTPEFDPSRVLQILSMGLYRSIAREFYLAFADRVRAAGDPMWAERAAHLRLQLDGTLDLAEIRATWSHVKGLVSGLLFDPAVARADQGAKEMTALWSLLQIYRGLSGDASQELKGSLDDKRVAEVSAASPKDKGLIAAAAAVAGGAVGAAAATHAGAAASALAAILTAAGSAVAVNFSWTRTNTRQDTLSDNFKVTYDLNWLMRELPVRIQRCRDAGLAPIFQIDELDKIDDLDQQMPKLIDATKILVAEQAACVFVTDRKYFRQVLKGGA